MKIWAEYNPAKDPIYLEVKRAAYLEGFEEGRNEWRTQGYESMRHELTLSLLEYGKLSIDDIAKVVEASVEYVLLKKAIWNEKHSQ
jgi:flagellar biosynthesis/type III secretory pathway protein FliH